MTAARSGVLIGALLAFSYAVTPAISQTATVAITGTVTDEGVECQAVRGDDGNLYTIRRTTAVRALRTGDRVRVEGKIAETSICQQGITIDVTGLSKAN